MCSNTFHLTAINLFVILRYILSVDIPHLCKFPSYHLLTYHLYMHRRSMYLYHNIEHTVSTFRSNIFGNILLGTRVGSIRFSSPFSGDSPRLYDRFMLIRTILGPSKTRRGLCAKRFN